MSLPSNFSSTEHLQDVIRRIWNLEVREWFSDLQNDPDISTGRNSLRTACLHLESDSAPNTLMRMMLFDELRRQPQIALPAETHLSDRVIRRSRPQILLYFLEDLNDVERGFEPVAGQITFRLMDETTASMTQAKAIAFGNRIKSLFAANNGFVWRRGKEMCSYSDWNKGYQLQLLCRNKTEGRRLVEQVLDIQQHSPEWEFFNHTENEAPSEAFPTLPPSETILGRRQRLPRRRPVADVRFQYATLRFAGIPQETCLFDRSGRFSDPLIRA